jgi:hypothetical protein
MPTFFFDFFDGRTWSADDDGLELASVDAAWFEAYAGARSMWAELIGARQDPNGCAFEVRDTNGEKVFRFGFAELLDECRVGQGPSVAMARVLDDTHRKATTARAEMQSSFAEVRRSLAESQRLLDRLGTFERLRASARNSLT